MVGVSFNVGDVDDMFVRFVIVDGIACVKFVIEVVVSVVRIGCGSIETGHNTSLGAFTEHCPSQPMVPVFF